MEVDHRNQCESGDLASSLAPSEEAILLDSPSENVRSVSSSMLESPPNSTLVQDIGTPYERGGMGAKKDQFPEDEQQGQSELHRLPYALGQTEVDDIDTILDRGPMPATPVYLEAAVANFCHEAPTKDLRQMWKRDSRIFHTHGLHRKLAHTATDEDFERVSTSIIKDPRCVWPW